MIGAVMPAIPGISLIAIAIFLWGLVNGFRSVRLSSTVAIVFLLAGIGVVLATYYGAKKAGASKWGQIGAIVGLLVGILGLLPALPVGGLILGILIEPILGAIAGECLYRRDLKLAAKVRLVLSWVRWWAT